MKLFLVLSLLVISCTSAQEYDLEEITYIARTRGASKVIRLSPDSCKIDYLGSQSELKINQEQWNHIVKLVSRIKLEEIQDLVTPSNAYSSDKKMAATLLIMSSGKTFESSTFDDGNPPKELKELVEQLFSLAEIEE